jgi:hypothetical protein
LAFVFILTFAIAEQVVEAAEAMLAVHSSMAKPFHDKDGGDTHLQHTLSGQSNSSSDLAY